MNRAARRHQERVMRRAQHQQRRPPAAPPTVARPVTVNAAWAAAVRARIVESDMTRRLADRHGLDVGEYLARVDEHLRQLVTPANIYIGLTGPALGRVLIEGVVKNIHDRRQPVPTDHLDPDEIEAIRMQQQVYDLTRSRRRELEMALYDLPADAPPSRFPIYGRLSADPDGGPRHGSYGGHSIALRPAVKARATFSIGDSLRLDADAVVGARLDADEAIDQRAVRTAPAPITAPSFVATRILSGWDPLRLTSADDAQPWFEAQIFGGVRLSDVQELLLTCAPPRETAEYMARLGIAWRLVPAAARDHVGGWP